MANNHETLTGLFSNIADVVRVKTGTTDGIVADNFPSAIDMIKTPADGSIPTKTSEDLTSSGATVSVPAGYYASDVSKSVETVTQATPSLSIKNATGVVTATSKQSAGYVNGGTTIKTLSLPIQSADTIIPGTSDITAVAAGKYTIGAVTVAGDADLVADNIVEGKQIFNVTGTAEPASALAQELSTQDSLIAELEAALAGKAVPDSGTSGGDVQVEDLSAELAAQSEIIAEQDELIAQLASALEGKAASGATVDTSTVTIYDNSGFLYRVIATTFENDMTNSFFFEDGFSENSSPDFSSNGGTIHNVIRNSVMIIQTDVVCHPDVYYGADYTLWQDGIYSFVITDDVVNIELYDNGEQ